jgi:hypothetical protein
MLRGCCLLVHTADCPSGCVVPCCDCCCGACTCFLYVWPCGWALTWPLLCTMLNKLNPWTADVWCCWLRVQICARMLEVLAAGQHAAAYTCIQCYRTDKVNSQYGDAGRVMCVRAWTGHMLSCNAAGPTDIQVRYLQLLHVHIYTLQADPGWLVTPARIGCCIFAGMATHRVGCRLADVVLSGVRLTSGYCEGMCVVC